MSAPGRSQVKAQFAAERKRSAAHVLVEVGAQLALLAALAEERADALLVAAALGDELLAALVVEVPPLLHEDGRDLELVGHDAQVRAQREADLLRRRQLLGDRVERPVEGLGALPHRLVEEVLLALDVGVERALLDADRVGEGADRRAVVALLGEEAGGLARKLLAAAHGSLPILTIVRLGGCQCSSA